MKIVVAGGAGFLGSHLCERLLDEGHSVVCVDNLMTGSLANIEQMRANNRFSYIMQDICKDLSFDSNIDYVLNFASPASPVDYNEHPVETLLVGSLGTLNCLKVAQMHGAGFLMASTSEVYGDPHINPQPESYWGNVNPVGARSMYDEAKRFSEALITAYSKKYSLNAKIARIFNTYGPRMQNDDGRVIPNFICQALRDTPLTIYGEGTQTRSFCYVSDLISGVIKLMNSDVIGPVNIGNPNEMTILELADKILQLTGSSSKLVFKALPSDDPKQRRPDITRAMELLKWQPEVSLELGLRTTISYFKNNIK